MIDYEKRLNRVVDYLSRQKEPVELSVLACRTCIKKANLVTLLEHLTREGLVLATTITRNDFDPPRIVRGFEYIPQRIAPQTKQPEPEPLAKPKTAPQLYPKPTPKVKVSTEEQSLMRRTEQFNTYRRGYQTGFAAGVASGKPNPDAEQQACNEAYKKGYDEGRRAALTTFAAQVNRFFELDGE